MQPDIAALLAAPIDSPRLVLEPLGERHAEVFFPALQDEAIYRWISMERPAHPDDLRARWRRSESSRMSPDGRHAWPCWAVRRRADGAYLGRVDAEIDDALNAGSFGHYFFSPHWGCGYATEAVVAATEQLMARGVQRFTATVTVGNIASARVLQKAGFAFTRILPGNDLIRGAVVDDEEYVKVAG